MSNVINGDCRPCEVTTLSRAYRMSIRWVMVLLALATLTSARLSAESPAASVSKRAPALSLETLYHPTEKHDFDGKLPNTHWIGKSPSKLLVRRDDHWNEVNLDSGAESSWPVVDQLAAHLAALDGVTQKRARSSAMAAVATMETADDVILVRIDKSLATVSATRPAKWLTRDVSTWKNTRLDPTDRRVAYTRDGDLFVTDVASQRTIQLTNDGQDTLLDGVLDWTYQEEIFGRGNFRGFWFSPDGHWLAMLRIDTSLVEPYFLPAAASDRGRGVVSRYPKAGDPIPHAELLVWDLRGFDAGNVPPAKSLARSTPQDERIITGVWWHPHQLQLLFTISDRLQTWRELRSVGTPLLTGSTQASDLLIREQSPTWVEPPKSPQWLRDGSLIWHSNQPTGRSRLFHLHENGQSVTPVTPEDFDVQAFFVAPDGTFAIVTGDAERGTMERHLYRVELGRQSRHGSLQPLTDQPGWHNASVSGDRRWAVDRYSTPTQPEQMILRSTGSSQSIVLAASQLDLEGGLTVPELFQIPTTDGVPLPAMLIRGKNASVSQPCPVVIEVYGGPRSPVVSSRWGGTKSLYRELLARNGITTLVVDNRSSAGRGIADSWSIRGRVGEVEFNDLMTAVKWLKSQDWVDSNRLAIRGWSFGGFMTLYAMTHSDAFVAGIAGGSVTDWREYDAFYTERYMGSTTENAEGYASTAPVTAAENLQGRVLLIHGESDDNVHPSSTLRMADALQKAGKDFQLMIYPGSAHGIREPKKLWHLSRMTHRFLMGELGR